VEDAPSGLIAGRAAGARTLAVCTSHTRDKIVESGAAPDFIVDDLTRVSARWVGGKVVVEIDDTLGRIELLPEACCWLTHASEWKKLNRWNTLEITYSS